MNESSSPFAPLSEAGRALHRRVYAIATEALFSPDAAGLGYRNGAFEGTRAAQIITDALHDAGFYSDVSGRSGIAPATGCEDEDGYHVRVFIRVEPSRAPSIARMRWTDEALRLTDLTVEDPDATPSDGAPFGAADAFDDQEPF